MIENEYKVIPSTLSGLVGNLDKGSPEPAPAPEVPQYVPTEEVPAGGGGDMPADFEDPDGEDRPKTGVGKAKGRLYTLIVDRTAAGALAIAAKGDLQDYRATKDEYNDLEEAMITFLQEADVHTTPVVDLFLAIFAIYGMKLPSAIKARREVEKVERQEQLALLAKRNAELMKGNNESVSTGA